MFATGFTTRPDAFTQNDHDEVVLWMKNTAAKLNTYIAGSHPFPEADQYYNRLLFCSPDGHTMHYDKHHLFTIQGENEYYNKGRERLLVEVKNWKILPLICYDLRFPVWSRNIDDYHLAFYSSNWPAARNSVWETLLRARAIENQCYVVGINRTGIDGNGIRYIGYSQVIDPRGYVLGKSGRKESVLQITLRKDILLKYRKKFPVLDDRDNFILEK